MATLWSTNPADRHDPLALNVTLDISIALRDSRVTTKKYVVQVGLEWRTFTIKQRHRLMSSPCQMPLTKDDPGIKIALEQQTLISIHQIVDLEDIGVEVWDGLLQSSEVDELFLTYEWARCWWKSLGVGRQLLVLVAHQDDQLVGIAPLMLSRKGRGVLRRSIVEFLGTGESDYCDFIISRDRKEAVLRAFFEYLGQQSGMWDAISLRNVPEHSSTASVLQEIVKDTPFGFRQQTSFLCPTLLIQEDPAFAIQNTRKKSLKRHFNYFNRNGKLAFRTAHTIEEVVGCLEEFFQQHIERRAIAGELSKFEDARVRDFYRCLATGLLQSGRLSFGIVTFDDAPIAYHFGFTYSGKFVWYKPTFNVDYMRKSPGEVLLKYLLEDAIENELREFDFTIGDEAFKRRFSNEIRRNCQIDVVRRSKLQLAADTIGRTKAYLKRDLPGPYALVSKHVQQHRRNEYGRLIRVSLQRYGITGTGGRFVRYLFKGLLFDLDCVTFYRPDPENALDSRDSNITVREGKISDCRDFGGDRSPVERMILISTWYGRLRAGNRVFTGTIQGSPVFYAWVSFESTFRIPGSKKTIDIPEDAAIVYDFHIMEDGHGQGASAMAIYRLSEELRNACDRETLICCSGRSAQKKIKNAGFRPFTSYTRVRLFGFPVVWRRFSVDDFT